MNRNKLSDALPQSVINKEDFTSKAGLSFRDAAFRGQCAKVRDSKTSLVMRALAVLRI